MNFARFRTLVLSIPGASEQPHFDQVSFSINDISVAQYQLREEKASFKLSSKSQYMLSVLYMDRQLQASDGEWLHIRQSTAQDPMTLDALRYLYQEHAEHIDNDDIHEHHHTVQQQVILSAPQPVVWDLLTVPRHISQWDDLAPNVDVRAERILQDQEMAWAMPDGHISSMKVVKMDPYKSLQLKLNMTRWPLHSAFYDIKYDYELISNGFSTLLSMKFGDYGMLPNADELYQSSKLYAQTVSEKLKGYVERVISTGVKA